MDSSSTYNLLWVLQMLFDPDIVVEFFFKTLEGLSAEIRP